jgi:hypothetical protein
MKRHSPLSPKAILLALPVLSLLAGCDIRMPNMGSILPNFASGPSTPFADPRSPIAGVPRGPDPIAVFAATATPGSVGSVNGEQARLTRAYNAASGRECREIMVGFGGAERAAVACREADGSFVSSRPLMRGSLR